MATKADALTALSALDAKLKTLKSEKTALAAQVNTVNSELQKERSAHQATIDDITAEVNRITDLIQSAS